ncbi:unnamed protein product [Schistosoma mattheei]|uniref:DUF4604 domain-containing protein n=1 Tax=Schistosoma mattheei TaxID=31246 RepID=A0A183PW35_9TREM|nr:unnamed protein product [Schistosoma mattheei]
MSDLAHDREVKIRRYKSKKALEERLEKLASYVDQPHVDEETKREFNLTLVQRWLCVAQDDIISLQNELDILAKGSPINENNINVTRSEPLRPFIITRSAAQAAVFGAGYPSLPTMTIEEFYDQQVAAGLLPPPKPILQSGSRPNVVRIDPSAEEREAEEKKKANQDELEDADDPDMLSKARSFDEFKDEHRRETLTKTMSKKPKVQFIQNEEPSFIKEFKQRAGIPTAATIDSKRTELSLDDNDEDNRPDEQPQIVFDPCSDVHELEARAFIKQWQYEHKLGHIEETNVKNEEPGVPSRIMFRSAEERCSDGKIPVKRTNSEIHSNNRPLPPQQQKRTIRDRSPIDSKRKDTKCSLLSFDLDEDEG